jgi:hypothetical protein
MGSRNATPDSAARRASKYAVWLVTSLIAALLIFSGFRWLPTYFGSSSNPSGSKSQHMGFFFGDDCYLGVQECATLGRSAGISASLTGKVTVPDGIVIAAGDEAVFTVTVDVQSFSSSPPTGIVDVGGVMDVRAFAADSSVKIESLETEHQSLVSTGDAGRWRFRVSSTEPAKYEITVSFTLDEQLSGGTHPGEDSIVPLEVTNTSVNIFILISDWMKVAADKTSEIVVLFGLVLGVTSKKVRKFVRKKWRKLRRRFGPPPAPPPVDEQHTV